MIFDLWLGIVSLVVGGIAYAEKRVKIIDRRLAKDFGEEEIEDLGVIGWLEKYGHMSDGEFLNSHGKDT
jgi:hypothetical protein